MEEAKDSSSMHPSLFEQIPSKEAKILPQSISSKEVEDSFLMSLIH